MPARSGASARRVNRLLAAFPGNCTYLEIGVFRGLTLEHVQATYRQGVDPNPRFDTTKLPTDVSVYVGTSDDFFSTLDDRCQFDIVFLDGLHTFRQTYRDLINALQVCPAGFVLIDDVVPSDSASANADQDEALRERQRRNLGGNPNTWHGDVFKVIVALSTDHTSELSFCTIVKGGKPQTLVWRKHQGQNILPIDEARLARFDAITFDSLFESGVPESFVPMKEEAALTRALRERAAASGPVT
jgi:hypothetical protein